MAQQGNRQRRSYVVFGLVVVIALFAGMATFAFLARMNNTVRVFYVKNPKGIQAYQLITEADLGDMYVQADTLQTMGGDKYQYVYVYDAAAKDGKGGISAIVGKYAKVPFAHGGLLLRFWVADASQGDYKANLYEQPGTKLITFQVPLVNALAGQLSPGDYIDLLTSDKTTGLTKKLLSSVQVIDIKYGSNPFAATTDAATTSGSALSADATATVSTSRDPLANTVNPAIGDRAIVIIQVPGGLVESLAPYLLDSNNLYMVATTPPGVAGSQETATTTTPTVETTAPATETSVTTTTP